MCVCVCTRAYIYIYIYTHQLILLTNPEQILKISLIQILFILVYKLIIYLSYNNKKILLKTHFCHLSITYSYFCIHKILLKYISELFLEKVLFFTFFLQAKPIISANIYIYISIYVCVCVYIYISMCVYIYVYI